MVRSILQRFGSGLVFHSILASLCTRIPVPLVDGIAGRIVRSSMFSRLGTSLAARELYRLSAEPEDPQQAGCMRGCLQNILLGIVLYPVRKIMKVVNILRNYQEVIDLAAHTFVEGYLIAYLIASELWPEQGATIARKAVDKVCFEVGTRPVGAVFTTVLQETRTEILSAFRLLVKKTRRLGPDGLNRKKVTQALSQIQAEEAEILQPVMTRVLAALDQQPQDYFIALHDKIRDELNQGAQGS